MISRRARGLTGKGVLALIATGVLGVSYSCKPGRDDTDRIGVIIPLTGEGALYGLAIRQGIDMAVEDVNRQRAVSSHRLLVVYEDDRMSPEYGVAAFRKLVNVERVPVIIGSAASNVTLSIAPLAEQNHIVLFSPASTADELKYAGDFIFRIVPANNEQGTTAAKFVREYLKAPNVAILFPDDDFGISIAGAFRRALEGLPIILDERYNARRTEIHSLLDRLREKNPSAVFCPGNYSDVAALLKQAREHGLSIPFVGTDGGISDGLIAFAGEAAEGSYFTMTGVPKSRKVDAFLKAYKQKYGEGEPTVFVYYAYDALLVVAEAIKKGGYTADSIKSALYSIKLDGLTGESRFDRFGEVSKPYLLYKVHRGRFELMDWRPAPSRPEKVYRKGARKERFPSGLGLSLTNGGTP